MDWLAGLLLLIGTAIGVEAPRYAPWFATSNQAGVVTTQSPGPSGGPAALKQQAESGDYHQNRQDLVRGTPETPFVIQIQRPQNEHPVTAQAQQNPDADKQCWWDRLWNWVLSWGPDSWTAAFTGLLFISTSGLWIFTALLWRSTRSAIQGEEKAATAMQTLAATAKETGERQLRAYVFIENAWVKRAEEAGRWRIMYRMKNFGQTPAATVTVIDTGKVTADSETTLPTPVETTLYGAMAPGGDFIDTWTSSFTLPTDETGLVQRAIWLVGKITYRDITKTERWTTFCFKVRADLPDGAEMEVHDEGNDYY
jgi:hypothetical protein